MAFKRTIAERLLSLTKISTQTLTNCRISSSASPSLEKRFLQRSPEPNIAPDPGDNALFRSFLPRRAVFSADLSTPLAAGSLMDKLRAMDTARNRIRMDGLTPPPEESDFTAEEARKLLKAAQVEVIKSKLREIQKTCISYSEFVKIIGETCSDPDQSRWIAKMLDESASVIIIGDIVFLRPQQEVVKAIQGALPLAEANPCDPRRKEFEEMETGKGAIDQQANSLVRRELWCGLGFLVVQTLGFMRLTFWELSWDVMEPICFYVTSMYFMAGYAFFLRTSKEPSFEGFYQSRFSAKQKRLMKLHNFDIERYNELKKALYPFSSTSTSPSLSPSDSFPLTAPHFQSSSKKG